MDRPFGGLPPSHVLPVIDAIPRAEPAGRVAPAEFASTGTRPWDSVPVAVPGTVGTLFASVLGGATGVGVWLGAVRLGATPCNGAACAVATWAGVDLMLVLAAVTVAVLTFLAAMSRGLGRLTPAQLAAALLATACGLVAVSGVVALLLFTVLVLGIAVALLVTFVDRF